MAGRKIVSIRLSEARAEYLADLRSLGRAPNTLGVVKAVLEALERIVGNKVVRNVDKKDINDYYSRRAAEGMQQSSLNLHTTRLRLFFEWCVEEGYLDTQVRPMRGRDIVKIIPKNRLRLTQEEFGPLLDTAPNPRDRIALALGLYLMLRNSEMRTLRIQDVSFDDDTVQVVRWKTRRVDTLPICTELRTELESYFMWYSTFPNRQVGLTNVTSGIDKSWFLAPGNKRRVARYSYETRRFESLPVTEMVLTPEQMMFEAGYITIVKKSLKALGYTIEPGEGVHTLRRSGARELFDELRSRTGFDDALLTVMSFLGHAQPSTTLIYLGVEREAERRNTVLKGKVMYSRSATKGAPNVVPIRPAGHSSAGQG